MGEMMAGKDNQTYETYDAAKGRLDQIVTDVRAKDVSLEASLDLLEEGVALANRCTELIDVASWSIPVDDENDVDEDDDMDAGGENIDDAEGADVDVMEDSDEAGEE